MNQRQVSFTEAISMGFNRYCCFTGRSSRSEYWWWALFMFIIGALVSAIFGDGTTGRIVSGIVSLAFFLPNLGLAMRRLHDIGRSGWWVCINFIPVIGQIILIVFFCQPSQPAPNQYGVVPNTVG